jgi:hypothetical protein
LETIELTDLAIFPPPPSILKGWSRRYRGLPGLAPRNSWPKREGHLPMICPRNNWLEQPKHKKQILQHKLPNYRPKPTVYRTAIRLRARALSIFSAEYLEPSVHIKVLRRNSAASCLERANEALRQHVWHHRQHNRTTSHPRKRTGFGIPT